MQLLTRSTTIAAAALAAAAIAASATAPPEGTWFAAEKDAARVQLSLSWKSSMWGETVARSELRGLSDAAISAAGSTPVTFRIEREPGVFHFQGTFGEGRGAGDFSFQPNRGFAEALGSLGIAGAERATDHHLMTLAFSGASLAAMRELGALGLGRLDLEDAIKLSVHRVTPDYVRSLRAAGLPGTSTVAGVVQMRIHRITPEYVRDLERMGYRDLSRPQLLQMGIHGVDRRHIEALARAGYRDLSAQELVQLRIHTITPAFIEDMREAGFRDLTPRELVQMKVHRISRAYVRALEALGYRNLRRGQLLQMGIHGVTPAYIRRVRDAGHRDLSPEALVRLKIHGMG